MVLSGESLRFWGGVVEGVSSILRADVLPVGVILVEVSFEIQRDVCFAIESEEFRTGKCFWFFWVVIPSG